MRINAKPKMERKPKFRYGFQQMLDGVSFRSLTLKSCCLPKRLIASLSSAVPAFLPISGMPSRAYVSTTVTDLSSSDILTEGRGSSQVRTQEGMCQDGRRIDGSSLSGYCEAFTILEGCRQLNNGPMKLVWNGLAVMTLICTYNVSIGFPRLMATN